MENFLEHNINIQEYITGNRFIDICEKLQITFCKTDYLNDYTETKQPVFVTHNSDYHIENNRYSQRPKGLNKWFTVNKDYEDDIIIPIPIGLESVYLRVNATSHLGKYSSYVVGAINKIKYIDNLAKQKIDHDKLIYLNINPRTYPSERQHVLNLFQEEGWVTNKKSVSWQEYYKDIASHKFVFSPRGNGIDCHRTWEALYLRTIPIVRESLHMNEFKDLPILFIKNWEDISYNYLSTKYEEMSSKLYDLSKMKISYWQERMRREKNNV